MPANSRLVIPAAAAGLAATIGLLWQSDVPLGVPGEWTWTRIAYSSAHVWSWIIAAVTALMYVGWAVVGSNLIGAQRRSSRAANVVLLAGSGFVWLYLLLMIVPGLSGLQKSQFVLYYRGSSGYFWQARYDIKDTGEFVAGYEKLLAERDYLHIGTHPPGLTLFFRGLLAVCESSPGFTDAVLATEPESTREAAKTIRANDLLSGREFRRVDEAVLWLAALLAIAAAAATVIPLYVLIAECADRKTAWLAASLWPLVPGVAIFLPKSDAVFPLISVLGPCLWLAGWRRRSLVCCCLAGLTLLGGMLLSLAVAPGALLTALATVLTEWRPRRHITLSAFPSPRPSPPRDAADKSDTTRGGEGVSDWQPASRSWWVLSVVAAAVGFFVPLAVLWSKCGLNLPRVWSWNVANHALFYEHNVRTWWKWLLVNPVEAGLAAGGPLAFVAIFGAVRSRVTRLFPLVASTAIVWGLLWISGKNMGEAARLWLLFQPWVVVAAAAAFAARIDATRQAPAMKPGLQRAVWITLLALQAIACIATVTRVDGFDLQV